MEVLLVLAGGNKELWLPWIATLSISLFFKLTQRWFVSISCTTRILALTVNSTIINF